jgi:ketosteroid isomerase-like protein
MGNLEIQSNADLAREIWMAVANADSEKVRALLARDIVWSTYASGSLTGVVHGPDAVIDLFARAGELTDDLTTTLIDVFESRRGAVLLYSMRATRGTVTIQNHMLLVMKVDGGLVSEVFTVPVDAEGAETFWLSN